jgi:Carbohydrate binding domain.
MSKSYKIIMLLSLLLVVVLVAPVYASSNIMDNVSIWRYQYDITAPVTPDVVSNDKIKTGFDANGMLNASYFDLDEDSTFEDNEKLIKKFSMAITEGTSTYDTDNVSIISEGSTALNGYDKSYDFFKRRMSEFYFNGTQSNRYILTMYTELLKSSDISYLFPRLHFKQNAAPSSIKYKFEMPASKYDKIYYDVHPEQVLLDNSYVNQGSDIAFKGDNLLNASGSFEKEGGWDISYDVADSENVTNPMYKTVSQGFSGWKCNNNVSIQQDSSSAKYGNYSLKITNNESDYSGNIRAKFDATPGDTYTVSLWAKASGSATNAKLWVGGYGTEDFKQVTTTGWTRLTTTITIPGSVAGTIQPNICVSCTPGSSILIDGVKVEPGSTATEYGNNLMGLATATVLYDSTNEDGIIIYTPQNYPEKRKWYYDDYVRKAFLDYSINHTTAGNSLILTYDVSGASMDTSNTVDFYFYVRPFKGSVIADGISAFKDNINNCTYFPEAYATITTLNKCKSYYPIEGYADQAYHFGFSTLHKGKATGLAPYNDVTSQQDWGVNGERGFNWGFITHNLGDNGNSLFKYYKSLLQPSQTLKDELRRYAVNYIDKSNDSKYNGQYVSGGTPNYKLLADSNIDQFGSVEGMLADGYNNFYFGQNMVAGVQAVNELFNWGDVSTSDKGSLLNSLNNMKNIYDESGPYSWTWRVNQLSDGGFEKSSSVNSGNWTAAGSMGITPDGQYTRIANNGQNIIGNYAKSTFSSVGGLDYSSQVKVKSYLGSGAKVWLTNADNPELIDSTPFTYDSNANLEAGTTANWSLYNSGTGDSIAVDTSEKHQGNYSMKFIHNSTNTNTALRNLTYDTSGSDKKYKATAWVKSANSSPVNVTIDVAGVRQKTFTVGNVWTKISTIVCSTNANCNNVGLGIPTGAAIYIDDVVLEETAEKYVLNDNRNGGLESGDTTDWAMSYQGTGDTIEAVSDTRFVGNYALKYTHNSSNAYALVRHFSYEDSISGRKYKASAWVKSADSNPVNVTISVAGECPRTYSVGSEWTNIYSIAEATNAYYNNVIIEIPVSKSIYIDNAVLEDTYESIPLNDNYNKGLEDGDLSHWELYSSVTGTEQSMELVSGTSHSGSYSVKYTKTTDSGTMIIRNRADTSSTAGKRYIASAWVKSSTPFPVEVTINLSGNGENKYTIKGEWTQITTNEVLAVNGLSNTVALNIPAEKSILIDDVTIMETTKTEPAYSIDVGSSSWATIKCNGKANDSSTDLKLYVRPQDQILVDTKETYGIQGWTTVGSINMGISNDSVQGSQALGFKNSGSNSRENWIESTYVTGTGFFDLGERNVASAKIKAKAGTTAVVWADISYNYRNTAILNECGNGDVEYGDTSNWVIMNKTSNDTLEASSQTYYEGNYSLKYNCNSTNALLRYSTSESSLEGKSYKISAMVKATGTGLMNVCVDLGGKNPQTFKVRDTGWTKIYTIVDAANKELNYANIKIDSGKGIYIDNLTIEETTEKFPINELYNSGAEYSSTDYWEIVSQGSGDVLQSDSANYHSGEYSLKYTHGSSNNTYVRNIPSIYSSIGKTYKATAWVKSADSNPVNVKISVSNVGEREFAVGSDWTQVYTYVSATSQYFNKVTLKIPQSKSIYIDDVILVETDESIIIGSSDNAGAEAGTTSQWSIYAGGTGDSIQANNSSVHLGSYSIQFTHNSSNSDTDLRYACSGYSRAGKLYRASAWVKNSNSGSVSASISLAGNGKKTYLIDNSWKKITTYVKATNDLSSTVIITIPYSKSILVDDIELVETDENIPLNFPINGDLETGSTEGFSQYNNLSGDSLQIESSEKHSGNYSLKFTTNNEGLYYRQAYVLHQSETPTVPGKKYRLTAYVKSATGSEVDVLMSISGEGMIQQKVGNSWTKLETELVADSANYNQVQFIIYKNQGIYIDDVVLEEVKEADRLKCYLVTDSSWTSIEQPHYNPYGSVNKLRIYTRPGDEVLVDAVQVERGIDATEYTEALFYDYSPLHTPRNITVINSHLDNVKVAKLMKDISSKAGDSEAYNYWNNIFTKGIDGMLWYVKKEGVYNLNDFAYNIDAGPNSKYSRYCLEVFDDIFFNESYRKDEIKPYVLQLVDSFMEDDKDDTYVPTSANFYFEIPHICYGLVWNDLTTLRTMASEWQTYYPTEEVYNIRALNRGEVAGVPMLGGKWYYGFDVDEPFTSSFGGIQLESGTYYLENSTDASKTVTITIKDRDSSDTYDLSDITSARELITDTALTINNYTVALTIPARTFRLVEVSTN